MAASFNVLADLVRMSKKIDGRVLTTFFKLIPF